ncbi:MAG: sulfatase [Acidobacteriota bacterium]
MTTHRFRPLGPFYHRLAAVLATCVAALALAGCSDPALGFAADRWSPDAALAGPFSFASAVRLEAVEVGGEQRQAWVTVGSWSWRGRIPENGRLAFGVHASASGRAVVRLRWGSRVEVLETLRLESHHSWQDRVIDLSDHAGRRVELEFLARLESQATVAWSPVTLGPPPPASPDRPNLLLIVVDTLRRDRLTSYGYERDTTPEIDRLLARRGVVFERAYAQAPWTTPSVASLLSSRYPGEFLGGPRQVFTVADEVDLVSEHLAAAGYRTAAFLGNPILRPPSGLTRGFETVLTSPTMLPAEAISRAGEGWLAAHGAEPFFLYLHYIDPHDPWTPPDLDGGVSPYFPEYRGEVSGADVPALRVGAMELADPVADLAHLSALYDSEIAYVDRWIGRLLDGLSPALLENTLIVFTADHGEELLDHQGWGHASTLYDELVRVPLILRWDGRLPVAERVDDQVRLLDVATTLVAAAGERAPRHWQGKSLLPIARGEKETARLAFASHLHAGPRRAMATLGSLKMILFDRDAERYPSDGRWGEVVAMDRRRMQRRELYDLERDPRERHPLTAVSPSASRLEAAIHRRLLGELPGFQLVAHALPVGERLTLTARLAASPDAWQPYFLEAGDRVTVDSNRLRLEIAGGEPVKGIILPVSVGEVVALEARLGDASWPADRLSIRDVPGLAEQESARQDWYLELRWRPDNRLLSKVPSANQEQLDNLRQLGYLGAGR